MSIVFGTTLKPQSRPLADLAAALAHKRRVPLRLVHVSEDPRAPIVLGTDEESILGPVRVDLDAEAERLRSSGAEVHVHLAAGPVVDALVSVAAFELAEMLLVGVGPNTGRKLLGDTAERVCRRSSVPVIVLRESDRLVAWLTSGRPLRILVGADLGRAAQAARTFAARLSEDGPCQIEVVFVVDPAEAHARLGLGPPDRDHGLSAEAETGLRAELGRLAPVGQSAPSVRLLAARGSADAHLVSLADQGDFDLVVVGQRRSSLVEALWYGSVARGVLRAAPVSVGCVPTGPGSATIGYGPPRVIIVGTDLGEAGERALAAGLGLAGQEATVHLVHVVVSRTLSASEAREAREHAWSVLSRLSAGEAAGARAGVLERHVLEGDAAEQLTALAERVGADLVVIASRRRGPAGRALLGSVARSLTESSRVPVLLVPPREE